MQMELSHKRARVELERAASTSARRYEVGVTRRPWHRGVVHGACQAVRQVSLLAGSLGLCLVRPQVAAMLDVLDGGSAQGTALCHVCTVRCWRPCLSAELPVLPATPPRPPLPHPKELGCKSSRNTRYHRVTGLESHRVL